MAIEVLEQRTLLSADITVLDGTVSLMDGDPTPVLVGTAMQDQPGPVRRFTVRNDGDATLTLSRPELPGGFLPIDPLVRSLAPGSFDVFSVQLDTRTPGVQNGEVVIASNDPDENPFRFTVSGTVDAALPRISVEDGTSGEAILDDAATPVDFGQVLQGQLGPVLSFIVHNDGDAPLRLGKPTLPRGYLLIDPLLRRIEPDGSDKFSVQFDSKTPGTKAGQITITTNDLAANPFHFAITGTVEAAAPEITVTEGVSDAEILDGSTTPLDFGAVVQGGLGPVVPFFVSNDGTAPLTLGRIRLPAGFLLIDPLVSRLEPGASDKFSVQLNPRVAGAKAGDIVIPNNDGDENPFNFAISGIVNAAQPDISVSDGVADIPNGSTTPISFGNVLQGRPGPVLSFFVHNDGDATLTLGPVTLPAGFLLIDPLVRRLVRDGFDKFSVQLGSATSGTKSGEIRIASNDPDENPFHFAITGTVNAASADINVLDGGVSIPNGSTTAIDFGHVLQGQPGPVHAFVVRNDGVAPLTLGTVMPPPGFLLIDPLVSRLEPGVSDKFSVQLDSTMPGTKSGEIRIANNDPDKNPFHFAIMGTVDAALPEITVLDGANDIADGAATPIDFGNVLQGQLGPLRAFTVRNDGDDTLSLGKLTLPLGFLLIDPLVSSLAPGFSDRFSIRLDSATPGVQSGQISIDNNDPDENPFDFAIIGTVDAALPSITVLLTGVPITDGASKPIDFGSAMLGQPGPEKVFTVRNDGAATLTLQPVEPPEGFRVVDPLVASLAPGDSDTFSVRLDTSVAGPASGDVMIPNNDAERNPFNFAIRGNVTAPNMVVEFGNTQISDGETIPIDLGTLMVNDPSPTFTFTVRNDGDATLTLGQISLPTGFTQTDGLVPSLAPGESDTFSIQVDTSTPGKKDGDISIVNGDTEQNPFNFAITLSVV